MKPRAATIKILKNIFIVLIIIVGAIEIFFTLYLIISWMGVWKSILAFIILPLGVIRLLLEYKIEYLIKLFGKYIEKVKIFFSLMDKFIINLLIVLAYAGWIALIIGIVIGFFAIIYYVFSQFGWLLGIFTLTILLFIIFGSLIKYKDGEILIAIVGTLAAGKIKAILVTVWVFLDTFPGFAFLSMSVGSLVLIEIPNPGVNELISVELPKYIWFSLSVIFNWGVINIVKKIVQIFKPSKNSNPEIKKLKNEIIQLRKENEEMNFQLLSLKDRTQSKEIDSKDVIE